MNIEVYTDGSATTSDRPGGWAFVVVIDGKKHFEANGYMPNASNNDAELEAAIQGLTYIKKEYINLLYIPDKEPPPGQFPKNAEITLVSDSQLVLGWASGRYAFRQLDKMDKFKTLQLLVHSFNVKTRWVEGHSGDEHNERCDKLANEARLQISKQQEKVEALVSGETLIGTKKTGVVSIWYKGLLKIINLENNIIEDYNRDVHGSRGSMLEIREDKSR